MAKVIVTGGAGFIGSHLVDALVARGEEVLNIDRLEAQMNRCPIDQLPKSVFYALGVDIRSVDDMAEVMKGVETVFHLAALPRVQYSIDDPIGTFETNVRGTQNVLESARQAGVKRFVFASSSSVYGMLDKLPLSESDPTCPMSPYAAHKLMGEILCQTYTRTYGMETVCLRYFNVYGPRLDPNGPYALVIGIFLRQRLAGQTLTITGDGTQTRDFIHVKDIVRANLFAADSPNVGRGEVINIGSGRDVTINDLAKLFGVPSVYITPRLEPKCNRADNKLASTLLGWKPTISLEEGIEELKKLNS